MKELSSGPIEGVVGKLLSTTVSRAGDVELTPRAGVRKPDNGEPSSFSRSTLSVEVGRLGVEAAVSRLRDVLDGVASLSDFRNVGIELREAVEEGGGDLNLGDMGQWGELSPDRLTLSPLEPSSTPSTLDGCS